MAAVYDSSRVAKPYPIIMKEGPSSAEPFSGKANPKRCLLTQRLPPPRLGMCW